MTLLTDIQVIFCDTALLVVNKPAGLRTLPDGYNPSLSHIKSMLEQEYGRMWVVHRLDKDTSGVLTLARSAEAHRLLNTQFEHHLISKVYHAFVIGNPEWQEKTTRLPLRSNGDRHHRTIVDEGAGKPAITHLRVLERFGEYSLVEANPETGRIHQIRAHLSALGLPVVGDKLYRGRGNILPLEDKSQSENGLVQRLNEGMKLHALSLEINHPITGERLIFHAPYPIGWVEILEQLHNSSRIE